jgi:hypothetical protein
MSPGFVLEGSGVAISAITNLGVVEEKFVQIKQLLHVKIIWRIEQQ